ncbi:MAG: hypothetical protein JNL54_15860 [Kineosporiaceae bacterium]|nr:hypothetical protein [Kineosporiaceae bacterium]
MKVAVPAESMPGERRVAVMPELVPSLTRAGLEVVVQSGAGRRCLVPDAAYRDAGAEVVPGIAASEVDVLLHVRPLHPRVITRLGPGAITIGCCAPASETASIEALAQARITSFAVELVPTPVADRGDRTDREVADALDAQGTVTGYRAVLEGALRLPRALSLSMTRSGGTPSASVLVLGAGTAGLTAIATAHRLGAAVHAYDVRPGWAEAVTSVGGMPVDLGEGFEAAGWQLEDPRRPGLVRRRLEALAAHVTSADLVITAVAGGGGKPPPRLVTQATLAAMRPGSVVVDLVAEAGGNVAGSVPGEDVVVPIREAAAGVVVTGLRDAASALPAEASRAYSEGVVDLLLSMTHAGVVSPDFSRDMVRAACLTHAGGIAHRPTADRLGAPASALPREPMAHRWPAGSGRPRRTTAPATATAGGGGA